MYSFMYFLHLFIHSSLSYHDMVLLQAIDSYRLKKLSYVGCFQSIPPVSEQLTVVQVGNCVPGGSIPAKQVTSFRESMCLAPKGLSP
jgi:hypothetical protein